MELWTTARRLTRNLRWRNNENIFNIKFASIYKLRISGWRPLHIIEAPLAFDFCITLRSRIPAFFRLRRDRSRFYARRRGFGR